MTSLEHLIRIRTQSHTGRAGLTADSKAAGGESGSFQYMAVLWALALLNLLLHLYAASGCGFYIDELCGFIILPKHAPIGYVDCSAFPLSVWSEWLSTVLLGRTTFALRLVPAVVGSANIVVAGLLAKELGGGGFAVSIAGLSVFVAPFLVFAPSTANSFSYESLPWSLSALFLARALKTGKGRWWWLVGMAWGAGLLSRPTMALFMSAVGLGLLLTQARVELLRKGFWLAVAVAVVCFSPALVWQTINGWPFLRFGNDLYSDEWADSGFWLAYFSRSKMLLAQPALLGPLNFLLAVVGVFYGLLFVKEKAHRTLLWACLAASLAFLVTSGRIFYMSPIYSVLLPFGCMAAARITEGRRVRWMRPVLVAGLVVQGLVVAPVCMPLFPKDYRESYSRFLCRGILAPLSGMVEVFRGTDQYEMVARTFNRFYMGLPAGDKGACCIVIGWAEMAAGVEFYGDKYPLPKIFSPHRNYAFWGAPGEDTGPVLAAWFNRRELERWFGSVEYVGRFDGGRTPGIFLCKAPKRPFKQIWQEMCNKDWAFRWKVERYIGNGEDPQLPDIASLDRGRRMAQCSVPNILLAATSSACGDGRIPAVEADVPHCATGRRSTFPSPAVDSSLLR